jgi:large subunit ribosomal protein L17
MLANMASSLIRYKRIRTTVAKAKALRSYIEPLVTKSRENTTHSRRVVFSYLQDKNAVSELFGVVAPKVGDRPGGYTRIFKVGFRQGDMADLAVIELVDFNETFVKEKRTTAAPKKRTRRAGSGKAAAKAEHKEPVPVADDVPVGDVEVPEDVIEVPEGEVIVPEDNTEATPGDAENPEVKS